MNPLLGSLCDHSLRPRRMFGLHPLLEPHLSWLPCSPLGDQDVVERVRVRVPVRVLEWEHDREFACMLMLALAPAPAPVRLRRLWASERDQTRQHGHCGALCP
jgi:hypothetical protein